MNTDFLCEKRLNKEQPALSEIVRNTAIVMTGILDKYTSYFPYYTDHSSLHSLQVIDFCNTLIAEQINMLNADEIFVLLMSCYLHDTGMGISDADYEKFAEKVISPEYREAHRDEPIQESIRKFHHEFSGKFIKKYAMLFDIPSDEYTEAIIQVSRGHRKTDLFSKSEYPVDYRLPNGNTVCLPYLASLIRLADEMDIAKDRNVGFEYGEHEGNLDWAKHNAIERMEISDDAFTLFINTSDPVLTDFINESVKKLQETLDICRNVCEKRTKFRITQSKVVLVYI